MVSGIFIRNHGPWNANDVNSFYLNLPICVCALPMAIFFVKLRIERPKSFLDNIRLVDWTGLIVFIGSITSALIAISWGGVQYEWSSLRTVIPLTVGLFGIANAVVWELFLASNPFLPKSLFSSLTLGVSYMCALFQGLALYMGMYYAVFYFSAVKLASPIHSGLDLLPATCLILPGSAIVSALITRFGHFRWAIWSGFVIASAGCGLLISWDENTKTAVWATHMCLFGLGMGMILTSVNFSIQAHVTPEDAGRAASMYAFFRSIGMTLGVAVGGTVFQNVMKSKLEDLKVPHGAEIAAKAESYIEVLKKHQLAPEVQAAIVKGYVHGFRGVFIVMTSVCVLGLVVSAAIRKATLDDRVVGKFTLERDPPKPGQENLEDEIKKTKRRTQVRYSIAI